MWDDSKDERLHRPNIASQHALRRASLDHVPRNMQGPYPVRRILEMDTGTFDGSVITADLSEPRGISDGRRPKALCKRCRMLHARIMRHVPGGNHGAFPPHHSRAACRHRLQHPRDLRLRHNADMPTRQTLPPPHPWRQRHAGDWCAKSTKQACANRHYQTFGQLCRNRHPLMGHTRISGAQPVILRLFAWSSCVFVPSRLRVYPVTSTPAMPRSSGICNTSRCAR
jgi:hypothetical protein